MDKYKLFSSPEFQNENLTAIEETALSAIIEGLSGEIYCSDLEAKEIAVTSRIPMRNLRGVLGSLVKKEYISINTNEMGQEIICLKANKFYLHPVWKESALSVK